MTMSTKRLWIAAATSCGLLVSSACPSSPTEPKAAISGRVVLVNEAGLSEMNRVRVDLGRAEGPVVPEESGDWEVTDLDPGVYQLSVSYVGGLTSQAVRSAYKVLQLRVVATSGGSTNVGLLPLALGEGAVSGRVVPDESGPPIRGEIVLQSASGVEIRQAAGSDTFVFAGVPVGRYRLRAALEGYANPAPRTSTKPDGLMKSARECGTSVVVGGEGEDGAERGNTIVSVVRTNVAVSPGLGETWVEQPDTWWLKGTSVSVHVTAKYASEGRLWIPGLPSLFPSPAADGGVAVTDGGAGDAATAAPGLNQEALWAAFEDGGYLLERLPEGRHELHMQFRDGCGYESPEYVLVLVVDQTAPQVLLANLGDGTGWAQETALNLRLDAVDTLDTDLRVQVLSCPVVAGVEACTSTMEEQRATPLGPVVPLQLAGAGAWRVHARVLDRSNNASAEVTLDTHVDLVPPTVQEVTIDDGADATRTRAVTLTVLAQDDVRLVTMQVAQAGAFSTAATLPFSNTLSFLLSEGDGEKEVCVHVTDAAGRRSADPTCATITLDTTPPQRPVVSVASPLTGLPTLSLLHSAEDNFGVVKMRVASDRNFAAAPWVAYATASTYAIPARDDLHTILAQFMDAAGNLSTVAQTTVELDTTPPTRPSVLIDGGATHCNSLSGAVVLSLSAEDRNRLASMQVAESPSRTCAELSAVAVDTFATTKPLTLSVAGPEVEFDVMVCARFADVVGNWSDPVSASIRYDTRAPVGVLSSPVSVVPDTLVELGAQYSGDPVSMKISDGPACSGGDWVTPSPGVFWRLPATDGPHAVSAQFVDAAGNVGPCNSVSITLDRTAPDRPGLVVAEGRAWVGSPDVSVTVTAGQDATELTLVLAGDLAQEVTVPLASAPQSITLRSGDGRKTVLAQLRDAAGNTSPVAQAVLTLDTAAPTVSRVRVGDGSGYVTNPDGLTTVHVECADGTAPAALLTLEIADDASTLLYRDLLLASVTLSVGTEQGPRAISVRCTDPAGNATAWTDESPFVLDHTPPDVSSFTLNGGVDGEYARDPVLDVHFVTQDDVTQVTAVALMDTPANCRDAVYAYARSADTRFLLSAGEGPRRLHLCAKDAAGNITPSPVPSTNAVMLDTLRPVAPTLQLGDGRPWVTTSTPSLTLGSPEADVTGYQVRLTGDLAGGPALFAWDARPATVALQAGEGSRRVQAQLTDAAGNTSDVTEVSVSVDTSTPVVLSFTVGNDSGYVATPGGASTVAVVCKDGPASAGVLNLYVQDDAANQVYDGPLTTRASISLPQQRDYVLTARCSDPAGHVSLPLDATVTVDFTPPLVDAVTINNGQPAEPTKDRNVTVHITTSDAETFVQATALSESGGDCRTAAYAYPASGSVGFALSAGDDLRRVHVCARDAAGNVTPVAVPSNTVDLDTLAPQDPRLALASTLTKSRTLGVTLSANGATQVWLAGDVEEAGRWIDSPYVSDVNLTGNDGLKLVTAMFRDAVDNRTSTVSAAVVLDLTPPSGSVTINGGALTTKRSTVQLSLPASGATQMYVSTSGCEEGAAWQDYVSTLSYDIGDTEGPREVFVSFRDDADNRTGCSPASIILDTTLDTAALTATLQGPEGLAGRTANAVVTLLLSGLTDDVVEMQVSHDAGFPNSAWVPVETTTSWRLTLGDATKTVHVRVRDAAGNESDDLAPSIVLDQTPPEAPNLSVADVNGDQFALSETTVELMWTRPAGGDVAGYELERYVPLQDTAYQPLFSTVDPSVVVYTDNLTGVSGATHYYRVRARDDLDNVSSWSLPGQANVISPAKRIALVRFPDHYRYLFTPGRGTFSLRPTLMYQGLDHTPSQQNLIGDVPYWDRPDTLDPYFNETLSLRVGNQDNTLTYLSTFSSFNPRAKVTKGLSVVMDIGPDSVPRLAFVSDPLSYSKLTYAEFRDGRWTTHQFQDSASDLRLAMAVDHSNHTHIVYASQDNFGNRSLRYVNDLSGAWGEPTILENAASFFWYQPAIVVASDDSLRVFRKDAADNVLSGAPNGTGGFDFQVVANVPWSDFAVTMDSQDVAHLLVCFEGFGQVTYRSNAGGTWSAPEVLDNFADGSCRPSLTTDATGNLHGTYVERSQSRYRYVTNTTGWSAETVTTYTADGSQNPPSSSIKVRDGVPHIALFDLTQGHHVLAAKVAGTWNLVPYDLMTSNQEDVSSLVFAPNGDLHLAYVNTREVWHHRKDKSQYVSGVVPDAYWERVVVDTDSEGNPHFLTGSDHAVFKNGAFETEGVPDGSRDYEGHLAVGGDDAVNAVWGKWGGSGWVIQYARKEGVAWTSSMVAEGLNPALAADPTGGVHLAYNWISGGSFRGLYYAHAPSNGNFSSLPGVQVDPRSYGASSMALSPLGTIGIAYNHYADGGDQVYLATNTGAGWSLEPVGTSGSSSDARFSLVFVGETPSILFYVPAQNRVSLATRQDGRWVITVVADSVALSGISSVGSLTLRADPAGNLCAMYYDDNTGTHRFGTNATGGWSFVDLARGFAYSSLAFDKKGNLHAAYMGNSSDFNWIHYVANFYRVVEAQSIRRVTPW
jgi:hypothetical protein